MPQDDCYLAWLIGGRASTIPIEPIYGRPRNSCVNIKIRVTLAGKLRARLNTRARYPFNRAVRARIHRRFDRALIIGRFAKKRSFPPPFSLSPYVTRNVVRGAVAQAFFFFVSEDQWNPSLCGRDSTGTPKPPRFKVGYILRLMPDIIAASDIYVRANNEVAVIDNQSALPRERD